MNRPVFRNPDLVQELPWRVWAREYATTPAGGLVLEDLDLIPLRFGKLVGRSKNADGQFILVEIKQNNSTLNYAQHRVFSLMHMLFRRGDPEQQYYKGFYLMLWYDTFVFINGIKVELENLDDFLCGKIDIPSMFDDNTEEELGDW